MSSKRNQEKRSGPKIVKPQVGQVLYDKDGYRIGDDGYPMTKSRRCLHRLLDVMFVVAWVFIVAAVALVIAALFQGQSFAPDTFIAYGGKQYNGYSVAGLMRGESLALFTIGLLSIVINHRGFSWMYDNGKIMLPQILSVFLVAVSVLWLGYLITAVALLDLGSCICIVEMLAFWICARAVHKERKTLQPSVIEE